MKKLITLFVFLLLAISCKNVGNVELDSIYKVTYKIYYPENTVIKEYEFKAIKDEASAYVSSLRGSNYLYIEFFKPRQLPLSKSYDSLESTTAPIEIVNFEFVTSLN